jgi:hypothetical protein
MPYGLLVTLTERLRDTLTGLHLLVYTYFSDLRYFTRSYHCLIFYLLYIFPYIFSFSFFFFFFFAIAIFTRSKRNEQGGYIISGPEVERFLRQGLHSSLRIRHMRADYSSGCSSAGVSICTFVLVKQVN